MSIFFYFPGRLGSGSDINQVSSLAPAWAQQIKFMARYTLLEPSPPLAYFQKVLIPPPVDRRSIVLLLLRGTPLILQQGGFQSSGGIAYS